MTDNQPLNPGNGGEVRPVGPSTANDAFWGPRPGGDRLVPVGGAVGPTQRRRCSPTRGAGEPWAR